MKNIIVSFAIAALTFIGSASAQARDHGNRGYSNGYSSGYRSCETPVYTERYLIGYDRCGRAIWGTRVVRRYAPVVRYVAPCPTPRYQSYYPQPRYYNRNSGIVIRASFCR